MNTWQKVVEYFNGSLPYVSRKAYLYDLRFGNAQLQLLETYRLYLTRAGYLRHVARGTYKIVKHIPLRLSSKQCYRMAYKK